MVEGAGGNGSLGARWTVRYAASHLSLCIYGVFVCVCVLVYILWRSSFAVITVD